MTTQNNIPTKIELHKTSKVLELTYADGQSYQLSCEYLRISSPSAEVRGHGVGNAVLQTGKRNVNITNIKPAGNYAIQISFDDGHDSGIYAWGYLEQLGKEYDARWQAYLEALHKAGQSREPMAQVLQLSPPQKQN